MKETSRNTYLKIFRNRKYSLLVNYSRYKTKLNQGFVPTIGEAVKIQTRTESRVYSPRT